MYFEEVALDNHWLPTSKELAKAFEFWTKITYETSGLISYCPCLRMEKKMASVLDLARLCGFTKRL